VTWLAPWPGQAAAFSDVLEAATGLPFPGPGEALGAGSVRLLWSGRDQALLIGGRAPVGLSAHGAVIGQTDGWARLVLTGDGAAGVLARLTPLDLRPSSFPRGRTARSLLGHMTAQITPVEGGFELLVMRSMAATAAEEVAQAMRSIVARG
jgi:sarcosine oxidase subunit gamma